MLNLLAFVYLLQQVVEMAAAMEIDDEVQAIHDKGGSKKRFEVKKVNFNL